MYSNNNYRYIYTPNFVCSDPGSIDNLVMKVDEIQEQIKVIDTLTTNQVAI